MKKLIAAALCALLLIPLAACGKPAQAEPGQESEWQLHAPSTGDTVVTFETSMGTIRALLFRSEAPLAVDNFTALAAAGYYDGLSFHRVVADFVVQTGDPTGVGDGGESASGQPFANEYSEKLHHLTGAIGMANAATDQNKSQFYFVTGAEVTDSLVAEMEKAEYPATTVTAYRELGGQPLLDRRYTVFGQVYEGLEVLEKINAVKVDEYKRPIKEVTLKSVVVESYTEPAQ